MDTFSAARGAVDCQARERDQRPEGRSRSHGQKKNCAGLVSDPHEPQQLGAGLPLFTQPQEGISLLPPPPGILEENPLL